MTRVSMRNQGRTCALVYTDVHDILIHLQPICDIHVGDTLHVPVGDMYVYNVRSPLKVLRTYVPV